MTPSTPSLPAPVFPTIDVTQHLSAVDRTVGARTLPAGEARVVTLGRHFAAPVDDVWDACTDAERIGRWFLPITGELRPGGRYQFTNHAGGVVERCDPPHSYAATWEYGDDVSFVEVRLAPEGAGTRFTLEHVAHVDDDRWTEFGPGAVGVGWDGMLLGLTLHLESGRAMDPETAVAWATSPEGVRFSTESSVAWCTAAIAGGDDPAAAEAAARRTTAAYTGG